ncbi:hypothetical protein Glo7428_0077 [Gloeocapsa sp. PCC 7428]|uniref:hypothetical protein n=1 Tax=Gloeocapsa sp. PCC 7428 TaxID=1173026 RepID=UPI0002A5D8DB|nr:hypothetical protein [Gloeocapsa sp. PCC 7428]AFZ28694.1 hypothetical protein Glo7428_0077 [Gloeocapsa sp. PCC 7428]
MKTHFITTEIKFQDSPAMLPKVIEAELQLSGKPLRWAITALDLQQQTATVEAVVTLEEVRDQRSEVGEKNLNSI